MPFFERAFHDQWHTMTEMERLRMNGSFNKSNWEMLKAFIERLTSNRFIKEAHRCYPVVEMAKFHDVDLGSYADIQTFIRRIESHERSDTHKACLFRAIYYAAWVRATVGQVEQKF